MQEDYDKLMHYALRILSKKRYTSYEIANKLHRFSEKNSLDKQHIDKVSVRLKELKYLDDEQYAKDYISDRIKLRPRGKFLLRRELRARGISKEVIEETLTKSEIDEVEVAIRSISKKLNKWEKYLISKQKSKAYQFLSSRGFEIEAIYKTIDHCYNRRVEKDL